MPNVSKGVAYTVRLIIIINAESVLIIVSVSSDSSNKALNADTTRTNVLRRMLFSFSWRRNFAILFSESPKNCISDVIEIAGLRVLCLLWILLVHICTVLYYVAGEFNYIMIIVCFRVHCAIGILMSVTFENYLSAKAAFRNKYLLFSIEIWVYLLLSPLLDDVNGSRKTDWNLKTCACLT